MVWLTAHQARGGKMIDALAKSMPPPDAEVVQRHDVSDPLGSLAESFRQGLVSQRYSQMLKDEARSRMPRL